MSAIQAWRTYMCQWGYIPPSGSCSNLQPVDYKPDTLTLTVYHQAT